MMQKFQTVVICGIMLATVIIANIIMMAVMLIAKMTIKMVVTVNILIRMIANQKNPTIMILAAITIFTIAAYFHYFKLLCLASGIAFISIMLFMT